MRENVKKTILELFESSKNIQSSQAAEALGLTRQSAHRYLKMLVEAGVLVAEGRGRGARYRLAESRPGRFVYETAELEEDAVWEALSAPREPLADVEGEAEHILRYALTELVNNAIDHSSSPTVEVSVGEERGRIVLAVIDGGEGVFRHVRDRLGLASELDALQEISKGKTTTMAERHSGEGLFFTSKAVDFFELESGALKWSVDNEIADMAVATVTPPTEGTTATVEVRRDTERSLEQIFAEYTEDFEFSKTRTVIKLFTIGVRFVSRSEGKRLCHGLERFREVVLDFKGVDGVGQGFADEVFRVWARQHPQVRLEPVNMSPAISFMIERARRGARE